MSVPLGMISLSSMKKKKDKTSKVTFKDDSHCSSRRTAKNKKKKREFAAISSAKKSFLGLGRAKRVIHQSASEEETPIKKTSERGSKPKTCSKQQTFLSAKKTKLPAEKKKDRPQKKEPTEEKKKKKLPDISYIVNWKQQMMLFFDKYI